jgi:hypothetical protein
MARVKGSNVTGAPIELTSAAPVDAKMLVSLKEELYTKSTWEAPSAAGANAGKMFCYYGMLVYVGNDSAENNGLYVLQNSGANDANADAVLESNWVRISQTDNVINDIKSSIETLGSTLTASLKYVVISDEGLTPETLESPVNGTVYLFKTSNSSSTTNVYEEWLYANTTWELIGSTDVNLSGYAKTDASNLSDENVASWRSKLGVKTESEIIDLISTEVTNNPASWREKLGTKSEIDTAIADATEVDALVTEANVTSWREKLGVKTESEIIDIISNDITNNPASWRTSLGVTSAIEEATKVDVLVTEENKASWRSALGIGDGSTLKNIADRTIVVDEEKVEANGIVVATKKYMDIYEIKTLEAISIEVAADTCVLTSVYGANIMETTISKIGDTFIATHEILGGEDFIEPLSLEEDEDSNLLITYQAPIGTLVEVVYFK